MKLCLITPINNLDLSFLGGMFFCLTKEAKENIKYYEFFKERKREGSEIILDNDVHERTEVSFEEHVLLALDLATIIIVPDVMRDKKKTLEYFHYFMDKFYPVLHKNNIKIMAVPQGNNMKEINDCFDEFNNDERVDFIGHSFDLEPYMFYEHGYQNQSINRLLIVSNWVERCNKKIHLLGCNNLEELYILSKLPHVYSTDGKFFSRIALAHIELTEENWKNIYKVKGIKMDFQNGLDTQQRNLFMGNVIFFKQKLSCTDKNEVDK